MFYFRILLFTFSFCCLFVGDSSAQKKPAPTPSPTVTVKAAKFESKEGNFSINISGAPSQSRSLEAEKGVSPGQQFFWQSEKTVFSVMYSAFEQSSVARAFEQMNSGTRGSIEGMVGKSYTEKDITFGKYPGKEFKFVAPNKVTYVMRNYLVNNVGYLVTAGYADQASEKEALNVLNSFKLLIEKK